MTLNTQLLQRGLTVCPLYLRLRPGHSHRQRKRLVAALIQALLAKGFVLAHKRGVCLLMPLADQTLREARHAALAWLTDQDEVQEIVLHDPVPIQDLLNCAATLADEQDKPLTVEQHPRVHLFLKRLAQGLLLHVAALIQRHNADPLSRPRFGSSLGAGPVDVRGTFQGGSHASA